MPFRWVLITLIMGVWAGTSVAQDRYFVLLFGSETFPRRPAKTHTWATLVRTTPTVNGLAIADVQTISWMPKTLILRPLATEPETGTNLSLEASIRFSLEDGHHIALWGPYEVHPTMYNIFRSRIRDLVCHYRYKTIDTRYEGQPVSNCIHAVSGMDRRFGREDYPSARYGQLATQYIALQLFRRDRVIDPDADHAWLIRALRIENVEMDRYQVIDSPLSDIIVRRRPMGWLQPGTFTQGPLPTIASEITSVPP